MAKGSATRQSAVTQTKNTAEMRPTNWIPPLVSSAMFTSTPGQRILTSRRLQGVTQAHVLLKE